MQVDHIISKTISEDTLHKGHLTVRFSPVGFTLLVSDPGYRPQFLKQYVFESSVRAELHPGECLRILDGMNLTGFGGETVLIVDSLALTLVPEQFFTEEQSRTLLGKAARINDSDKVFHSFLRDRNSFLVFSVSGAIDAMRAKLGANVKILHAAECLVSLSDQIDASDHQRGVVVAEVQPHTLDILVIREDNIILLNRFPLKDTPDFIYHALNCYKQLSLDRERIPVYLSGIIHPEHELYGLLRKYVRTVKPTPYYLEELTKPQLLRFMILSEGAKCA